MKMIAAALHFISTLKSVYLALDFDAKMRYEITAQILAEENEQNTRRT